MYVYIRGWFNEHRKSAIKNIQGDTKKTGTFEKKNPNYHCFCKTFLWRKDAVDRY